MAELNGLPAADFVAKLGGVFEYSPWIAEMAANQRPFPSYTALLEALNEIVGTSGRERQMTLINAHPDLAGRLARNGQLTPESAREQSAAGLTHATSELLERIQSLNAAYRTRFGFPFIICARLNNVETILESMEQRISHQVDEEILIALQEISKIAKLRLSDIVAH